MRPALFWAIKQRVVVISYRHLRTTYWSHEDRTNRLFRNSKKLPLLAASDPEERSSLTERVCDMGCIHSAQFTNLL